VSEPGDIGIKGHYSDDIKHAGMIGQQDIPFAFVNVQLSFNTDFFTHEGENGSCPESRQDVYPAPEMCVGHYQDNKHYNRCIDVEHQKDGG
jgi:hypothetical protein